MKVKEITCKSFVNRMQDGFFAMRYLPYRFTGNIYRGCTHDCVYCFARRTHYYIGLDEDKFSEEIFIKKNCVEILDKEFKKLEKNKSVLVIGTVADTYQPLEMRYRSTRRVLEKCLEYEYPCFIETKSPLITEDIDVIEKLAKLDLIGVG
jgi:DNA repair photolyase